jgi:hypothetical protein
MGKNHTLLETLNVTNQDLYPNIYAFLFYSIDNNASVCGV